MALGTVTVSAAHGMAQPSLWSARCIDTARYAVIAVALCAPISTALTSVAVGVMLLAWLMSGAAPRRLLEALRQPVGFMLMLFLLVLALGLLYGVAVPKERLENFLGWRRLAYVLIPLGLFGAALWKWRFVKTFVVMAGVGVVASYLAKFGWVPGKPGQLPGVVLQNHATQGVAFSFALLCALFWMRQSAGALRWLLLGLTLALAANVVLVTPARSGYLALLVALIVWAWSLAGARRRLIASVLVVLGMAAAYTFSDTMRARVDLATNEILHAAQADTLTSMGTRVLFYQAATELIRERPLMGYGAAGFGKEYSRRVAQRYSDWRATPSADPHNIYLFIAVNHGLVGLAAFLLFLVIALRSAPRDAFGWIGVGCLLIIMATSLFSSHFRTFPEGHLLSMFLGVLLARSKDAEAVAARGC